MSEPATINQDPTLEQLDAIATIYLEEVARKWRNPRWDNAIYDACHLLVYGDINPS